MIFQKTAVLSWGIWKIPSLSAFIPESRHLQFVKPLYSVKQLDSVIGWGKKPSAKKARALASRADIPYIALEDGFVRSLGLGVDGARPLGIIVDPVGVYYDANSPSKLENLLNDTSWFDALWQEKAEQGLALLLKNRISKYNCFRSHSVDALVKPYVLLVDQTQGDASVTLGMANSQSFEKMLCAALDENPHAMIRIRQHPDVTAGKRKGYLSNVDYSSWADAERIEISKSNSHPWDDMLNAQAVYVVTSQLGMEAVLAGKDVRCFGMPCYAGWGLTEDELTIERRRNRIAKEHLFAAAYLRYTRYVDPITDRQTDFETIANLICDQQRHYKNLPKNVHYHGFSLWKKSFLKDFSGDGKQTTFSYSWQKPFNLTQKSAFCEWASGQDILKKQSQNTPYQTFQIEDGFLRSVGLGSDLARPCSLVYDHAGIYYDARQASDVENIVLNHKALISDYDKNRARKVLEKITQYSLSKYNPVGIDAFPDIPEAQQVILVTGQVQGDASLRFGQALFDSNEALLRNVRQQNPDTFIIYKPHPDVVSGNRQGSISEDAKKQYCDWYAENANLSKLLDTCDELHTATSLTGFEALLRGKEVHTYGMPFYAGWGLTQDKVECLRRKMSIDLETLAAAALIHYPVYVHPEKKVVCSVEHIVSWLVENKTTEFLPPFKTRVIRAVKKVVN